MKSTPHLAALVCLGMFVGLAARAEPTATVAEPGTYRMSDYRAAVPATLDGKPALTVAEAHALWDKKAAAFVDILPQAPKPAGLAPGTLWRDKPRFRHSRQPLAPRHGLWRSGTSHAGIFPRGLKLASGGDLNKPLVFYCSHHCWMSWNAAKRAKTLGYMHVLWYQEGTQGWEAAGYPLKEQTPSPRP